MIYAFEGADGAGKSTVIQQVANKLNYHSKIFKFPSDETFEGQLAKKESDPYVGAIYFLLDMKKRMDEIASALDQDNVVLIDRFWLSTVTYAYARLMMQEESYPDQEYAGQILYPEVVEHLFEWFDLTIGGLSLPEPKIIYLDLGGSQYDALDDDQATNNDDSLDEDIEFQRFVYTGYYLVLDDWSSDVFHYNVANNGRRIDLDILSTTIAQDIEKHLNTKKT